MEHSGQRTFQTWAIGLLVVLNLAALTLLWVHSGGGEPSHRPESGKQPDNAVELLRHELGLTADQAARIERLRSEQMGTMKSVNDELDSLKVALIDNIFDPHSTDAAVESLAARIGRKESDIELLRFRHFRALAEICDPGQRERLRPILEQMFGNGRQGTRPPSGKVDRPARRAEPADQGAPSPDGAQRPAEQGQKPRPRTGAEDVRQSPPQPGDRERPPSLDEKLRRYTEQLSLSAEQTASVRRILNATRVSEESFKQRTHPTEEAFELEKQRLRTLEEQKIDSLLDGSQKRSFESMIRTQRERDRR